MVVIAAVPALVGAFWGAPLVARELEAGTHRLVWNQTVTRTRWLTTKLAVTTAVAALAVGALALAVTWWSHPLDGVVSRTRGGLPGMLTPVSFAMRGLVPVGYTVFAVALGVAVGAVLRRSLPAMAVTLALYVLVQVAVPLWVRPHLVPPTRAAVAIAASTLDSISLDGPSGTGVDRRAHRRPRRLDPLQRHGRPERARDSPAGVVLGLPGRRPPPRWRARSQAQPVDPCLARLASEGYTQRVVYQPAGNFWPIQLAETARTSRSPVCSPASPCGGPGGGCPEPRLRVNSV